MEQKELEEIIEKRKLDYKAERDKILEELEEIRMRYKKVEADNYLHYWPPIRAAEERLRKLKEEYKAGNKVLIEALTPQTQHTPERIALRYGHKMRRAIEHLVEEMNTKLPVDMENVLTVFKTSQNGDIELTIEIPIKIKDEENGDKTGTGAEA